VSRQKWLLRQPWMLRLGREAGSRRRACLWLEGPRVSPSAPMRDGIKRSPPERQQREGLPRQRRRRRIQNPRAGWGTAHPHHRRARRGAPTCGRGLRQGWGRQEHVDAASRGRPACPRASDCDPGRGLQRSLTGVHGGSPGGAVRSPSSTSSRPDPSARRRRNPRPDRRLSWCKTGSKS
jgi:hypothetical protein